MMLSIQQWDLCNTDAELRAISVRVSDGHGEDARTIMLLYKVLIKKHLVIDALLISVVAPSEFISLLHETWDHTQNVEPLKYRGLPEWLVPLLPVHNMHNFSAAFGTTSM